MSNQNADKNRTIRETVDAFIAEHKSSAARFEDLVRYAEDNGLIMRIVVTPQLPYSYREVGDKFDLSNQMDVAEAYIIGTRMGTYQTHRNGSEWRSRGSVR